ncbi:MAG: hypothetical protein BWY31_00603 [Lentisphaerae bacterium ADurb.Bin242]|nr:MAG: hypothetical protein BWY31_00603 [Lentisphaerae bacterium ADurb.Bin242]
MKKIYINQDNHQFYLHPAEDMTEAGCRALVDYYAEPETVKGILFCTNVQRALYDSNVWERFSNIDDDNILMTNLKLLSRHKVDQFAVWLQRCRELNLEGWLTMRMNDCHGLGEVVQGKIGSDCYKWPTEMWLAHPELRRAPYRSERSWEGAFNYMLKNVRDHHLALAEEILNRWDMYGLELDWMRWGMMVPPGSETEALSVLTTVVRQIRCYADKAEKRVGHKILLAHRVPSNIETCLDAGYDVITWAREGLADMITFSSFGDIDFSCQTRLWRALLGEKTVMNLCPEFATVKSYPGGVAYAYDFLTGSIASSEGFDNFTLFNDCYQELYVHEEFLTYLRRLGNPGVYEMPRRIPFACSANYPGSNRRAALPMPLRQPCEGTDFARMEQNISLRFPYGGKAANAFLLAGFSAETDRQTVESMTARMNTVLLNRTECPEIREHELKHPMGRCLPEDVSFLQAWKIPDGVLHPGNNVAEFLPEPVDGSIVWAEITLLP